MKKRLLILFLIIYSISKAQLCLNDIDLRKVPQAEIVNLIVLQQSNNVKCIDDIEASCIEHQNLSEFYKQTRTYYINESIENVWQNYIEDNPTKIYNSRMLAFGLMLCKHKKTNNILYRTDNFGSREKGQIIYLKLRFLSGLYKMAVAFEIISIDSLNKSIEFSYVKGGKSNGTQKLSFRSEKDGSTKILHTSYYKSNFYLRDKFIYPFFHSKVTNQFHRNVKQIIAQRKAKKLTVKVS